MGEWTDVTWGDVVTLQRGYDITKSAQVLDGAVPVISSGGQSSFHDQSMSSGPGVVMGRKGTLGRVYYVDGPFWPHDTTLWVKDFKGNHPRFVYYALKAIDPDFLNVGSASPTLNRNHVHPLPVKWPSRLAEQRAIAEVLGALDDKIAANDGVVATADALAEALTLRALNGEPVSLSEAAIVTMGSSPPGTSYNEDGVGVPFYQGVRDFGVRFPSRRVSTTAPVRMAAKNDTLLSVRAPVGRTNLANEELCLGRGVAGLRSRMGRPMTLFHQVRAARSAWAPYEAEGTVFGAINKSQLESIELPAIDPGRADELEEALQAIEASIAAALSESSRLAATRDALLPLLMSGKIRVKDAEKQVEALA